LRCALRMVELRWRPARAGANGAGAAAFTDGPVRDYPCLCLRCPLHGPTGRGPVVRAARVVDVPNPGVGCACAAFAAPR